MFSKHKGMKTEIRNIYTIRKSPFFARIDAEAEAPILWPPDSKRQLIRKDPDAGKD